VVTCDSRFGGLVDSFDNSIYVYISRIVESSVYSDITMKIFYFTLLHCAWFPQGLYNVMGASAILQGIQGAIAMLEFKLACIHFHESKSTWLPVTCHKLPITANFKSGREVVVSDGKRKLAFFVRRHRRRTKNANLLVSMRTKIQSILLDF